jgi:hypothetical protein
MVRQRMIPSFDLAVAASVNHQLFMPPAQPAIFALSR